MEGNPKTSHFQISTPKSLFFKFVKFVWHTIFESRKSACFIFWKKSWETRAPVAVTHTAHMKM